MPSQLINTFGLLLDIVGAYILFWRAYPQPAFEEDIYLALEDATLLSGGLTVAEIRQKMKEEKIRYSHISKCGLALLFAGFTFQLIATWITP